MLRWNITVALNASQSKGQSPPPSLRAGRRQWNSAQQPVGGLFVSAAVFGLTASKSVALRPAHLPFPAHPKHPLPIARNRSLVPPPAFSVDRFRWPLGFQGFQSDIILS